MTYDVVALGELLIDFTMTQRDEQGYPTMQAHPGGAPANFLAALSKYGASTAMIGKVGQDAFGELLKGTLEEIGVDTTGVILDPEVFTTLAFVTVDEQGERSFSFARKPGADTQLEIEEVLRCQIEGTKVIHFGTLSLSKEPARRATRDVVSYGKSIGKLITFDPNLRKMLWEDLEQARQAIEWGLEQAHVVKLSEEELEFLFGEISWEQGVERLLKEYGVFACAAAGLSTTRAGGISSVPELQQVLECIR